MEIKFGNRNFGELFKDEILNWKLNLEIGRLEFRKLGIEFGNRNFEEVFKDEI